MYLNRDYSHCQKLRPNRLRPIAARASSPVGLSVKEHLGIREMRENLHHNHHDQQKKLLNYMKLQQFDPQLQLNVMP